MVDLLERSGVDCITTTEAPAWETVAAAGGGGFFLTIRSLELAEQAGARIYVCLVRPLGPSASATLSDVVFYGVFDRNGDAEAFSDAFPALEDDWRSGWGPNWAVGGNSQHVGRIVREADGTLGRASGLFGRDSEATVTSTSIESQVTTTAPTTTEPKPTTPPTESDPAMDDDPNAVALKFLNAWAAGDSATLDQLGAPEALGTLPENPGPGTEFHSADRCFIGTSGSGGSCPFDAESPNMGFIGYDVVVSYYYDTEQWIVTGVELIPGD